jgi:hypothetical protein
MKEYAEGEKAFFDGFRRSVCPYRSMSRDWVRWNWGWLAAEQMELLGHAPKIAPQGRPPNPDTDRGG